MTKTSKIATIPLLGLGIALMAGTAFAGPKMTFGPNDEGALQLDYKGQFQMTLRDTGSGENNSDSTMNFNFRRNRLALMGKYGDNMSLYVQTEYISDANITPFDVADSNQGSEFQLLDAVMRFKVNDAFRINVGKFKYNLSRENLEACEMPLTLDRSLFIRAPYTTTRDTGVAVWGNLFDDMFQYRVDAMEGRKAVSGETAPASNFRYSARAHVTLLDPENDYGYKGTYLGKKKVATIGAAYQFEPEVAYGDTLTRTDKKDYKAWTVDGFVEYPLEGMGTVTASAAYEKVDLEDAYLGGPGADPLTSGINGQKNGYYVKGGYMLPNLPLQLFVRYERWRFAELNGVFDQRIDWYGGGFNYYLRGQNLKLTFEANSTGFNKAGGTETTEDFMTYITQLQLIF
ncbi:selenite/tellurite reduction operon porin ExtI [Citrifermentans bremense]|uniref:selenite/tellurite reduction operon porin ExtI n=1 Tax=Citrifermentans bremense TaxID=60035 RepID=UPI00040FCCF5|nr:selenite/tellurite reduction operon porin ExtI [Citrifermentans bremense]